MAKTSGLGQAMYLGRTGTGNGPAYDIGGDVGSIDSCDLPLTVFDDTGIDKSSFERLPGLLDAKLGWTGFWNNVTGGGAAVTRALNGYEAQAIWSLGSVERVAGFAMVGLVTDFNPVRQAGGGLTLKAAIQSDAGEADFGTIGANSTDASPVNHTGYLDIHRGPTKTITGITLASPGVVTATAHGFATGDTVWIAGTNSTPVLNGSRTVTVIDPNTFSVAVNTSGTGNAGSVYRTSSRFGGRLYVAVLSIGSGSVVVKVQDSADDSSYADVTSMATAALTATTSVAVVKAPSATQLWRGYLRIATTGTFTNCRLVALVHRGTGPSS